MLDPHLKSFMDMLADFPAIHELPVEQVRKRMRTATRVKHKVAVASVEDMQIPAVDRQISARCYRPADGVLPLLVFFHGGGWTVGDLDTHDDVCRRIAREAGCVVIAVDYRLAPEHPFPAAVNDALAAVRWIISAASVLQVDPGRIAVGGDSAGGNLTLTTCLQLRDQGEMGVALQWLLYPSCDLAAQDTESYHLYSERLGLSAEDVEWFTRHYLIRPETLLTRSETLSSLPEQLSEPLVSPLRALSLAGLPPTYVGIAEYDVLRDEGFALVERLQAEGVEVSSDCFSDQIHGFANYATQVRASAAALSQAIARLNAMFEAIA